MWPSEIKEQQYEDLRKGHPELQVQQTEAKQRETQVTAKTEMWWAGA